MEWRFNLLLIIALLKNENKIKSVSLKDKVIYFKKLLCFIVTLKKFFIAVPFPQYKSYCQRQSFILVLVYISLIYSVTLHYNPHYQTVPGITYFFSLCHLPALPSPCICLRPLLSAPQVTPNFSYYLGFPLSYFPSKQKPHQKIKTPYI